MDKPHRQDWWVEEQLRIHGSSTRIAEATGIPGRTIRRAVKRYKDNTLARSTAALALMQSTDPVLPLVDELRISGNGVVSSDWHLPLTNYANAARLIESAVQHGATSWLLIVGDFFNLDALSRFDGKQKTAALEIEMEQASKLLVILLDVFDTIYLTKGNHDWRLMEKLGLHERFEQFIKILMPDVPREQLERIVVTKNDYAIVDTPEGTWWCAHTHQYSKIPLSVPRELCDIHGMHVAAAHRHHHGITMSKGGYMAVELGGLFDASKTEYLRKYTTTFPKWVPGWMILHEGRPYLPALAPAPPIIA